MQSKPVIEAFVLLGTNLGDRFNHLLVARHHIEITVGKIVTSSSIYETAAWGKTDQSDFLNQVIKVKTDLMPPELLMQLLAIEKAMGRSRIEKWGPRVIDLDILLYDSDIVETENLTIPHPALHERMFSLIPLAEIAPEVVHPKFKKNISTLLRECTDQLPVRKTGL